ncbi:hypothetical protein KC318_g5957 [Hortaea werneckii]|nr:hypothetical protein KC334_g6117 [Hortaea werneckii]KAI7010859.1 hypothetical protein KC355_g5988 [Hortaea werneckii]KAI7667311.1 hypothetical protein KC318_g5957 [Hortaea werneckii]
MSGTARNDSMADDAEDTPNNVQSNKVTEYILNEMWKRVQASANESSKMNKALELSNYRASIYQAQAEAYKEAANPESEGTRSGFMTRGMALGVLADAIARFPALSAYLSSEDVVNALLRVEPIETLMKKAFDSQIMAMKSLCSYAEASQTGAHLDEDEASRRLNLPRQPVSRYQQVR